MASFGESLRREREMRGVSLEEIAATTKINLRFLKALEAEDFAKLPGGIFTRSFLRAYASYLGLDIERILAEYQLVAAPTSEGTSKAQFIKLAPGRLGSPTRFVPWLVAVPLLVGGYALYRYSHRTPEITVSVPVAVEHGQRNPTSSPPVSTAQNTTANPSSQGSNSGAPTTGTADTAQPNATPIPADKSLTEAENPPSGGQPNLPESGSTGTGTAIPSTENAPSGQGRTPSVTPTGSTAKGAEGDLVLEVTTTERAWVAVDADGKAIFQGTLSPTVVKTFTAKDSFEVWTGNAQGTLLTLNGAKQKSLGREGEVKRIRLTRNGFQQPAP